MTYQNTTAVRQGKLPILTTLPQVPPFAVGLVRDLRVRWALEEAGEKYQVRLVDTEERQQAAYRQLQPFGQTPAYQEEGLDLFESGAILQHIAKRSPILMPEGEQDSARVTAWMFAALNTVEPHVLNLADIDLFHADQPWAVQRRPALEEHLLKRLGELNTWLKDRDYLAGPFSVADILMATVLRSLRHTDLVARYPALNAFLARCSARPAFKRALADQTALFAPEAAPAN